MKPELFGVLVGVVLTPLFFALGGTPGVFVYLFCTGVVIIWLAGKLLK